LRDFRSNLARNQRVNRIHSKSTDCSPQGDHFPTVTLVVRKSGFTLYRLILQDVLISSVNDNASETDENGNLLETITFNYAKINWTFFLRNPDGSAGGSISRTFDVTTNRGVERERSGHLWLTQARFIKGRGWRAADRVRTATPYLSSV